MLVELMTDELSETESLRRSELDLERGHTVTEHVRQTDPRAHGPREQSAEVCGTGAWGTWDRVGTRRGAGAAGESSLIEFRYRFHFQPDM